MFKKCNYRGGEIFIIKRFQGDILVLLCVENNYLRLVGDESLKRLYAISFLIIWKNKYFQDLIVKIWWVTGLLICNN